MPPASRVAPVKDRTARSSRATPAATTTITIAHRISRGTLTVYLDGRSILSDEFSKTRWAPFHMTQWSPLTVPSGKHRLTAVVKDGEGKIYRSEPCMVAFEAGKDTALRVKLSDDVLVLERRES